MQEYINNSEEDEDEIKIIDLIKVCLKYWKVFAKWSSIGLVVGVVVSFGIPKQYSSEAVIVPEVFRKSVSGSISSLASLAGVNLSSMSGSSDAITFEAYPNIVKSNPFIYDILKTDIEFTVDKIPVSTNVYDYIENYTKSSWWSYPFRVPGMILSLFKSDDDTSDETLKDSINFSRKQEIIANVLRNSINVKVDRKTQIVTISTKFQNPVVTAKICETVVELLKKYITQYRTEKSRNTLAYFEKIYKDIQNDYVESQRTYAKYVDSNQDVQKRSRLAEEERLENEMQICYDMYMSCSKELQNARAAVQQETPVLAVIKPASIPNKKDSPSKVVYGFGFAFLAFISVLCWVIFLKEKMVNILE